MMVLELVTSMVVVIGMSMNMPMDVDTPMALAI